MLRSLMGLKGVVWDEAENRLHAQKALLEFMLGVEDLISYR